MSVRKISYEIEENKISPAAEQFAGSQGDIKASELSFTLSDELWSKLPELSVLRFRFDGYDGEGNVLRGDSFAVESKAELTYTLPEAITRYGGRICVYLIITQIQNEETEMELYSFPARLRLNSLPAGSETSGERESLTTLAESAKQSERTALEAADRAEDAAENLDGDNIYYFDGGNADGTTAELYAETTDELYNPESEDEEETEKSKLPVTSAAVYKLKTELQAADNELDEKISAKAEQSDLKGLSAELSEYKQAVADYIVEQGTEGIWTYHKWNSGIAECWGELSQSIVCDSQAGTTDFYAGTTSFESQNYPEGLFVSPPNERTNLGTSDACMGWLYTQAFNTESATGRYNVIRWAKVSNAVNMKIYYHAIGNWK